MSVKSEVSAQYTASLHEDHIHKRTPVTHRVLMTGDQRPGSIGERIHADLVESEFLHIVTSLRCDVRDPNHIQSALSDHEGATALIMCHGVSHLDWIEDCPIDKVQEIIDVNLTGTAMLVQEFVRRTIRNHYRKTIIITGSMAHKAVLNGSAVYCASKAGVAHLARCLAWELAPKGFDVFCIHPSNTLGTPMSEETIAGLERYRGMSRKQAEAYWNDSAIRSSSLTTADISALVQFLITPAARYLAGAQLDLAGGQR